jgi:dephospho-CoA kinase
VTAARGTSGRRPVVIGLTGPIGCGKSTIAGWLAELGAAVVDADAVARDVTGPGAPTLPAIRARFGPGVFRPDGSLDRAALGRVVFDDPAALRDLEAIVHPAVRPRILEALDRAAADRAPAVVVEAIKLVEGGLAELCDEVWLVTCSPVAQRARLAARGLAPADAEARRRAQRGLVARLRRRATRIVDTSGDPAETRRLVADLYAAALREAAARG